MSGLRRLAVGASQRSGWQQISGPLFRKYVALFLAVVCVALLSNGLFEIWFSYQEHKTSLIRIQREQAEAAAAKIGQFIKEIESQVGWTTQLPWSSGATEQRRFDGLRLLRQVPAVTELAQLDATGKEQLRVSRLAMDVVGRQTDYSQDPKFTEAMAKHVYYGPVYFSRPEHREPRQGEVLEREPLNGVGIDVTMADGLIKVVTPIENMPAAKAGVTAGDIIIALDDEPVRGLTLNQVVEKLRGAANTQIKLTVTRQGH